MRARLADAQGNALVTAIIVTFLVLTIGLSTMAAVDVQQGESRKHRERESTFQLSEGVLSAQIFQLSRRWPGSETGAYPATCTQASGTQVDCPAPAAMSTAYSGADYRGISWLTTVRDNGGGAAQFYDDAVAATQPQWDANGDNMMWVRAESRLIDPANPERFKERILVALVRAENVPLNLPRATLVADHFRTTNQGNKTIIDTNGLGNEWLAGEVIVRCEAPGFDSQNACAQYNNSKQRLQLDPEVLSYKPAEPPPPLSPERLDLLRARAISDGNYFATGCAPSLAGDEPGEVVYMASPGGTCRYQGNNTYNAEDRPGVVIMDSGKLELLGNSTFYGLIYHANLSDSPDTLVELGGTTSVFGSIQVAGRGGIYAGSSSVNLVFNPNYVDQIKTYGTAGIVQNSFRELQP